MEEQAILRANQEAETRPKRVLLDHDQQHEDDTDNEDYMYARARAVVPVDASPALKEQSKLISKLTTQMFMFLHHHNRAGFDKYTKYLTNRYPNDPDISMLCAIYKLDDLRNNRNEMQTKAMIKNIDGLMLKSRCPSLAVRYLTSKAFTEYLSGHQKESLSTQGQAVQMGALQPASDSTAYNLMVYALNAFLHRIDDKHNPIIPAEDDWEKSERYHRMALEQHLIWTRNLEDGFKIPDADLSSFFLLAYVRYIFCLVRSCVRGGFGYFDKHYCPPGNLHKAEKCIERVKSQEGLLSPKMKFEFLLAQCDYFLRKANISVGADRENMFLKSEQLAIEASAIDWSTPQYMEALRVFTKLRLQYIQTNGRLRNAQNPRPDDKTSAESNPKFSTVTHMDPFKTSTPTCSDKAGRRPIANPMGDDGTRTCTQANLHSDTHNAECLQCALSQTTPKESSEMNQTEDPAGILPLFEHDICPRLAINESNSVVVELADGVHALCIADEIMMHCSNDVAIEEESMIRKEQPAEKTSDSDDELVVKRIG